MRPALSSLPKAVQITCGTVTPDQSLRHRWATRILYVNFLWCARTCLAQCCGDLVGPRDEYSDRAIREPACSVPRGAIRAILLDPVPYIYSSRTAPYRPRGREMGGKATRVLTERRIARLAPRTGEAGAHKRSYRAARAPDSGGGHSQAPGFERKILHVKFYVKFT